MRVELTSHRDAFLARHTAWWLEHEAARGVFLRYARGAADPAIRRLTVTDRGQVQMTAVVVPGDQILLSDGPAEAAAVLARTLADQGVGIPGVFAPHPTSGAFAEAWASCAGDSFDVVKRVLHYEHAALRQVPVAPGRRRRANPADTSALVQHARASQAEGNTQRPTDPFDAVARDLAAGARYVWETSEHGIVASAALLYDRSPRSVWVDEVFTDPAHRGQGFATALVGELTQLGLEAGRIPMLSVDAANAPARRVYEKLGYEVGCQMDNLRRRP